MFETIKPILKAFVLALIAFYALYLVAGFLLALGQADTNQKAQENALLRAHCDAEAQGVGYVPRKPGEPDPCEPFRPKAPAEAPSSSDQDDDTSR